MPRLPHRLIASVLVLGGVVALPSWAASSTSSAVSDSIGTSVGSISDSFKRSSDSSSKDNKVADGDYQVIEVAEVAGRPGTLRLTLHAAAGAQPAAAAEESFYLYLPQPTAAQAGVAQGAVVQVRQRAYGIEFARADTRQPFFLVLRDEWHRELPSNAVVL